MYQHPKESEARARRIVGGAGYAVGGQLGARDPDRKADIAMIEKAVGQHETAMHPGTAKTRLRLADGGSASGAVAPSRLDQRPRSSGGKKPTSQINIIVAGHRPDPNAGAQPGGGMPPRPPMAPPAAAAPPPPRPMPPPGAGAPPPGPGMGPPLGGMGMPGGMQPRPMIKTGGRPAMTAGAGSGEGRQEKRDRLAASE